MCNLGCIIAQTRILVKIEQVECILMAVQIRSHCTKFCGRQHTISSDASANDTTRHAFT